MTKNNMTGNDTNWEPKPKQRYLAELLANPEDRRTQTAKFEEAGVPQKTFYRWKKDPNFIAYVNSLIPEYTNTQIPVAWRALCNQAAKGNIQAIKLFFEMKNLYTDKQKVEVTGEAGGPLEVAFVPIDSNSNRSDES